MKILKELVPYLVIITVVIFIRTFIATPVRVDGSSMVPKLKNNDILILNKLSSNYKRFDIVVVKVNGSKLVKRIIGLPGEKIEYKNNVLYIDGKKIKDVTPNETEDFDLESLYNMKKIPNNYYFVMGDNRMHSSDSRDYRVGLIRKDNILGKTILRIFPFNKIGTL